MTNLTSEEIHFFKEEGYLIKRKVMNEKLTARARERLWENAPAELDRTDSDTWIGPIEEYRERKGQKGNDGGAFSWYYRSIGREGWMVRMLATDPSIWKIVEQLLGKGDVRVPETIRGIYCRLPEGNSPEQAPGCHTDKHAFHLGLVGYIDDVPPNGGGFTVWPKSHRVFYYNHRTRHTSEQTEEYATDLTFFKRQSPVDCHGEAGDIIFWHHRLAHASGRNRSKVIRKAVLADYEKHDLEASMNEPPCKDMWQHWPGIPSDPES